MQLADVCAVFWGVSDLEAKAIIDLKFTKHAGMNTGSIANNLRK